MPTSRKSCPVAGCPAIIPRSADRCLDHTRPNTAARGYGAKHQARSRSTKQRIRNGELVLCQRCGQPITDADDCDEGHDDFQPLTPERTRARARMQP